MTRINVVPVSELCDQHLLAEHRELTRIPNCINKGRYNMSGQPTQYTLGKGHVKFFYDKLRYLHVRYDELTAECIARGFNPSYNWPIDGVPSELYNDYRSTEDAIRINRERIADRIANFTPRYTEKVLS